MIDVPKIKLDVTETKWDALQTNPDIIPYYLAIDIFNYISKLNREVGGTPKDLAAKMITLISGLVTSTNAEILLDEMEAGR